ncbi:MAG: hypothetical protein IJ920_06370 [Paludibacteraceae bacterium]|nr:hypothetical protein [Paludibacteraceae bacterium]
MPGVYSFPITYLWRGGANEKDRIEQVIRIAIANHPVFQMKVDWRGLHGAAPIKDLLHGRYHDVELSVRGNDIQISARFSRILGDGKSAEILLEDIRRAYEELPLEQDDYWGYVARFEQHKYSSHYRISRDWLIKEFADESVPVRPTIDRKTLFTVFPPKPGLFKADYSNLQEKIQSLSETHHLSMDGFFSLCTALAIAEYCGTDEAALTWAYEGRETPEEQRIFGSLHRDVPFQISRKSKVESQKPASRGELIKEARNQIRSGIAHSDYPYTLTAPYSERWNYAVNVLRSAEPQDMLRHIDLPIEVISVPEQKYAYALLDVEIHEHPQDLSLWFRYSATHYKESSIRRFAAMVRQYAEWLLE